MVDLCGILSSSAVVLCLFLNGIAQSAPQSEAEVDNSALLDTLNTTTETTLTTGPTSKSTSVKDINQSCDCIGYSRCKAAFIDGVFTTRIPDDDDLEYDDGSDVRTPENKTCHYLEFCCLPSDVIPLEEVTRPPVSESILNTCGNHHPKGVDFKNTGSKNNEANYGEFPWMVAVLRRNQTGGMECGGSIIHPQVILTAAHCVQKKTDLLIRAGEWDTQTENEMFPLQERNVKQVIIHYAFGGALFNDVALLVLDTPLKLTEVVSTICLPEQDEDMDGRSCLVSGWGKDVFGKEGMNVVILKKVEQPTVSYKKCLAELRKTRLTPEFRLHQSFMCAGGEIGKDACIGDGGSPLACPMKNNPKQYVQAGIVAWGIGCGTETPAVYARVSYFRTWIDEKLASLNLY